MLIYLKKLPSLFIRALKNPLLLVFVLLLIVFIKNSPCLANQNYIHQYSVNDPDQRLKPYVILISIDGMRFDYIDKYKPPFFKKLQRIGSYAKALVPPYPSKTYPSHISIATGLWPENHGITGNRFFDPHRAEEYLYSDFSREQDGSWYSGVALWSIAEENGMRSATMFWPGSDAPKWRTPPTYYYKYDHGMPYNDRISQIMKWLKLPSKIRPHFLTLYMDSVDHPAHKYGPANSHVKASVMEMDQLMRELYNGIKSLNLPINLVIVSDHGMGRIRQKNMLFLDELVGQRFSNSCLFTGGMTNINVFCDSNRHLNILYQQLKKSDEPINVYKNAEIPKHLHLQHRRSGELIIIPKFPHLIEIQSRHSINWKNYIMGYHGWDPTQTKKMNGIFYVYGPAFNRKKVLPAIRSIDVFPMITEILDLEHDDELDGELKFTAPLLKSLNGKTVNAYNTQNKK